MNSYIVNIYILIYSISCFNHIKSILHFMEKMLCNSFRINGYAPLGGTYLDLILKLNIRV